MFQMRKWNVAFTMHWFINLINAKRFGMVPAQMKAFFDSCGTGGACSCWGYRLDGVGKLLVDIELGNVVCCLVAGENLTQIVWLFISPINV